MNKIIGIYAGSSGSNVSILDEDLNFVSRGKNFQFDSLDTLEGVKDFANKLQKLKIDVEDYLGENINGAVISIPNYLDNNQRQSIKTACKIADLECLRLIDYNLAAALAYEYEKNIDENLLMIHASNKFDISLIEITEGTFEVETTNYTDDVKSIFNLMSQMLKYSDVTMRDINKIILTGDKNKISQVKNSLNNPSDNMLSTQPIDIISKGAAIQGEILSGAIKDILALPVTSYSIGIETLGGVYTRIIEKNTTIPTYRSRVFSTAEDNQSKVEIHVLQGEREMSAENKTLGKFILSDIPPAPRGIPQIEVTFDIDSNGIVNVSAKDLETGKEQKIKIE